MIRRLQTKHRVRPHGMDPTQELTAGPELELIADRDGQRRDVILRRPGQPDFVVYDGNIAGMELEAESLPELGPPSEPAAGQDSVSWDCWVCDKRFPSKRALQGHISRVHLERKAS